MKHLKLLTLFTLVSGLAANATAFKRDDNGVARIATTQTLVSTNVSVATTPTLIYNGSDSSVVSIAVSNLAAANVYVGHATVSTTNGTPIGANSKLGVDVGPGAKLYGVSTSGTADVRVLKGKI